MIGGGLKKLLHTYYRVLPWFTIRAGELRERLNLQKILKTGGVGGRGSFGSAGDCVSNKYEYKEARVIPTSGKKFDFTNTIILFKLRMKKFLNFFFLINT